MAFQGYNTSKTFNGWFTYNFLSLGRFQNKYQLQVKPLTFFLNTLRNKMFATTNPKIAADESLFNTFLQNQNPSRIVYKTLI